jgi:RNase H-fold protein (predicted Holliday junction resolvase)
MLSAGETILGIDPGTRKCGFAIVLTVGATSPAMGIEPAETLAERVALLVAAHAPAAIAIGAGTNSASIAAALAGAGIPIHVVDEIETTLRARARYFDDHPPRGWRRFVPRGMLLPPRPIDDYAALLIAERYLLSRV